MPLGVNSIYLVIKAMEVNDVVQLEKLYNKKKEEPRAETEEWRYWQAKEENLVNN